jgi:hypothetical protein
MSEMDDRAQVDAAQVVPQQAAAVKEAAQASRVMAGVIGVLLLMVPAAFVVGWRLGRTIGRLRGY